MKNPFCHSPLPTLETGLGLSLSYAHGLPARAGAITHADRRENQHPTLPRRPVVGEALIDADGVVWLVDTVETAGAGYVTSVSCVTRTAQEEADPVSHHLCQTTFEDFCRTKGIVLRAA